VTALWVSGRQDRRARRTISMSRTGHLKSENSF
jgi:hypothetical protein